MTFQTKANAKNKQKTPMKVMGKKAFDNSRDDSGNGQMVKSPGGKTPKGKQSLGDRKVSFQVPEKNTPGKKQNGSFIGKKQLTPGKKQNGSFVGKKQLTPGNKGKIALQEFQGRKKNGKGKDSDDDDDDDDDDEEEEDDFNEEDVDDDDEEDDDDDDEEDDDDDDDEEEDDDDDDEDDSDEEEEKSMRTGAQNKTKTPIKAEKTKKKVEVDSSQKGKKEKNMKSEPQNIINVTKNAELKLGWRERDKKRLFMKNLPLDVQKEELQDLSSDILDVILPKSRIPLEKRKNMFALLKFANESKAEENFKILQKKKLRDSDITLDFVGEKRKMRKPRKSTSHSPQKVHEKRKMQKPRKSTSHSPQKIAETFDTQKLKVSELPVGTTISQLAALFPRAYSIYMDQSKVSRYATMRFDTAEIAAEAFQANQGAKISGTDISIAYSSMPKSLKVKKRKKYIPSTRGPAAKKVKVETDGENIFYDLYY